MKKLILIALLSFVALSCSKDSTSPQNENRIKNDIPDELLGKWKEVAERETDYTTGEFGPWVSHDYVIEKEFDWYFKEYSVCCLEQGGNCDSYTVSSSKKNKITIFDCDGNVIFSHISSYQLLKGNELVFSGVGIDTVVETKYIKVE